MAVKYVLVERGNPGKPNDPKKFYAQHKSAGEVTLRQLVKEISARSTVGGPDVMAVLESFLEVVPEKLAQGLIVRLGELGSFSGTVTSEGVSDAKTFTAANITSFSVRFIPGKELKRAIAAVDFEKTTSNS